MMYLVSIMFDSVFIMIVDNMMVFMLFFFGNGRLIV